MDIYNAFQNQAFGKLSLNTLLEIINEKDKIKTNDYRLSALNDIQKTGLITDIYLLHLTEDEHNRDFNSENPNIRTNFLIEYSAGISTEDSNDKYYYWNVKQQKLLKGRLCDIRGAVIEYIDFDEFIIPNFSELEKAKQYALDNNFSQELIVNLKINQAKYLTCWQIVDYNIPTMEYLKNII